METFRNAYATEFANIKKEEKKVFKKILKQLKTELKNLFEPLVNRLHSDSEFGLQQFSHDILSKIHDEFYKLIYDDNAFAKDGYSYFKFFVLQSLIHLIKSNHGIAGPNRFNEFLDDIFAEFEANFNYYLTTKNHYVEEIIYEYGWVVFVVMDSIYFGVSKHFMYMDKSNIEFIKNRQLKRVLNLNLFVKKLREELDRLVYNKYNHLVIFKANHSRIYDNKLSYEHTESNRLFRITSEEDYKYALIQIVNKYLISNDDVQLTIVPIENKEVVEFANGSHVTEYFDERHSIYFLTDHWQQIINNYPVPKFLYEHASQNITIKF